MAILGFRDPYAYIHDQIYSFGVDDQGNQILYDKVKQLTRD